ncbi:MAG: PEP-CTERM sorting domain-containing protein [Rubrivivax sp.]|nr:MAG: PEP-CTERM sorting domain-containing protein [Rubrivivax sp.]
MDIGNGLELQDHGVTMSGVRDPNTGTGPWVGPVNFQPLQQRAYVNDPSGSYQYDREVEAFWRSSAAGGFLSARTKVIGVADLDVSVSGGEGSASAGLTFAPEGQTAFGEGLSIGSNATLHKHITFEFSNLSDSTLRVHATATSRAALSAVPEPGVVSLLLAGAGVAGLMARRRRA